MQQMFDLTGKVAVVTGGNGGIGLGMGRGLAAAGATVVVAARNARKTAGALAALRDAGAPAVHAVTVDVGDEASVARLFERVAFDCGRLDILINNAGMTIRKPAHQMTLAEWQRVIDTNLTGAFLCARAAYPALVAAGGGKVINIGSILSVFGAAHAPAYGASKGGLVQLTKSLAVAWAPHNIQVNAVLPGWIDTELTESARAEVAGLNERVLARTPVKRWGTPEDFAGIAVFLASRASDFVTGAALTVDGGYSVPG